MKPEALIPGLKFSIKHNLTQRETEILLPFMEKDYTAQGLSDLLGSSTTTIHHLIQRLKLKKLLVLKDKDERGTYLYKFNLSQLEDQ